MNFNYENDLNDMIKKEIIEQVIFEEDLNTEKNMTINEDQGEDEEVPIRIKTEEIMLDDVELPFEEMEDQQGILTINGSIPVVSSIINDHQSCKELMENSVKSELKSGEIEIRDIKKEFDPAEVKKLKCQYCSYSPSYKSSLKTHIEAVHLKIIRFSCKDCDYKCYYKHHMDKHIKKMNHSIEGKYEKCNLCDFQTKIKFQLQKHIRNNHSIKYKCPHCTFTYSSKQSFTSHIESVHEKIKRFQCQYCDYNCYAKESLKGHINARHLDLKEFKCDFCYYKTIRNTSLKQHISSIHETDEGFKCKYCNYCTNKKEDLKKHFQFVCDNDQSMKSNSTITNSSFNSLPTLSSTLTQERNEDTEKSLEKNRLTDLKKMKCEHCGYSTCWRSILKQHIERVHLKMEKYKCDHCEFESCYKSNIVQHIKTVHSKNKKKPFKFSCQCCDYKTNRKDRLKAHINGRHLDIKNFKCKFCNYKTAIKYNLNQHLKKFHVKKEK